MLHSMISGYKRLLSLAYVDKNDEFHTIQLCVVEDNEMEQIFRNDFEARGILYNKILTENCIDPYAVNNMRIVSSSIMCIESFVSWN